MFFRKTNKTIKKILPPISRLIDPGALQKNNKLLSDRDITRLKMLKISEGLTSKKEITMSYSVIRDRDNYYAIYDEPIGRGTYGKASLVQNLNTGEWCVLKKQNIKQHQESKVKLAKHEEGVLHNFELNKTITLFPLRYSPSKQLAQHFMLMKLEKGIQGESLCTDDLKIPGIMYLEILIGLLKAMQVLHQKGYLHRDLKPRNFVVDPNNLTVSLVDFGTTEKMDQNGNVVTQNDVIGTPIFYAPELKDQLLKLIKEQSAQFVFNEATDVAAAGLAFAQLVDLVNYEKVPDSYEDLANKDKKIVLSRANSALNLFPKKIYTKLLELINNMTTDAQNRYTADQALAVLEDIKREYLASLEAAGKIRVALLDVNKDWSADMALRSLLQGENKIILKDISGKDKGAVFYLKIKKQLEMEGFIVDDCVFINKDPIALEESIKLHLADSKLPIEISFGSSVTNSPHSSCSSSTPHMTRRLSRNGDNT